MSAGAVGSDISLFGVAGISGLVGMFSKQATDKLRETFDNFFLTEKAGERERRDKLDGAGPVIKSLVSASVPADGNEAEITIKGEHFANGSTVIVSDEKRITEFESAAEPMVHLKSEDTAGRKNSKLRCMRHLRSKSSRIRSVELDVTEIGVDSSK
jgi:hypothetical protein